MLEERRVDFHLPRQGRSKPCLGLVPRGNLCGARGQLALGWDDPELLLTGERLFADLVPALIELALVLRDPLLGHVMRRVRRSWREVDEEGFVWGDRLLLTDVVNRLVGKILGEVVTLFGRSRSLNWRRPIVEGWRVLARFAADEAVEALEPRTRWPAVVRSDRRGLEHRYLVTLAELRRRVAVQSQCLGEWRARIRAERVVAGCGGRDLCDPTHADGVMIAAREQRGACRRAQRSGMEARVLETLLRQPLGSRCLARSAECAR